MPQWRDFRADSQSDGTSPSYCWDWRSYDRACKLLLKAGLIEMVSECIDTADGRLAARYRLSASIPSPGQDWDEGITGPRFELVPPIALLTSE
jgi:hypothetical protein